MLNSMAAQRCPSCKLLSPGTATVCDCGRSFVDGAMTPRRHHPLGHDPSQRARTRRIGLGLRLGGAGAILVAAAVGTTSAFAAEALFGLGVIAIVTGSVAQIASLFQKR